MKSIVAASIAILTLTGAATAAPMQTPPWWFPTWGTWAIPGDNVKICARMSFNVSDAKVTVTNTDGTAFSFSARADPGLPDGLLNPDPKGFFDLLRDACARAREHYKDGWDARWYKINIGNANPSIQIIKLQGSVLGGTPPYFIQEVTVPTGVEKP